MVGGCIVGVLSFRHQADFYYGGQIHGCSLCSYSTKDNRVLKTMMHFLEALLIGISAMILTLFSLL